MKPGTRSIGDFDISWADKTGKLIVARRKSDRDHIYEFEVSPDRTKCVRSTRPDDEASLNEAWKAAQEFLRQERDALRTRTAPCRRRENRPPFASGNRPWPNGAPIGRTRRIGRPARHAASRSERSRRRGALRLGPSIVGQTPAMAAGVTPKLWEMSDMAAVLEAWETAQ